MLSPSTYAWTSRGSMRSSSISIDSPRAGSGARTPRRGVHARDELGHRERLDEVVVSTDVERVNAIVLGAAGADDDDRRADALRARVLVHAPAVALRQHQGGHADS